MERNVGRPWTAQEDAFLRQAVAIHGENDNWKTIAQFVPGRTNKACRKRWRHSLSPNVKKSAWTPEEDELLLQLYAKHHTKWSLIARQIPGRTDDACSKRYREALDPSLKKSEWTPEEDSVLLDLYQRLGGKWGQIGQELTRSGLACRNRWRLLERKKSHAQPSVALDPAPAVQNTTPASDPSVSSSWTDLPVLSYWQTYTTDAPLSLDGAETTGIDTSHGIIPRVDPPPFQFTSSSLSSALSTPRPQPRLPPAQPPDSEQQRPQFNYEITSGQIHVDCDPQSADLHRNVERSPDIPVYNPEYGGQVQACPQSYNFAPNGYAPIDVSAHTYGDNRAPCTQISLGHDCPPQVTSISFAHHGHDRRNEHQDIVMGEGNPDNQNCFPYHQNISPVSEHNVSPITITIPESQHVPEDSHLPDVCPSPYSSYTPTAASPRPPAVIQLSPAEPDLHGISETSSRNSPAGSGPSGVRRRGRSRPSTATAQGARRKQGDRPRKLDSDLPVSSDPSIKAYACGHPQCWPASAATSSSIFATSHGLSEHCKERHADMNIIAVGGTGNDQPFRCGLEGCGRGWKSLNGLQYHLQVSKAHFIKAITTASAPSSPPATPADAASNTVLSGLNSDGSVAVRSSTKYEKRKEHRCPHPSCPNVYKQLSGLRYHLLHAHHHGLPVQLSDVPPTLARKIKEKESKARLRLSLSPDTDIHV